MSAASCDGARGGSDRDVEDLDVVVHVEHHEPAHGHCCERNGDSEERKRAELEANRRKEAKRDDDDGARAEHAADDQERESGHGTKR